MRNALEANATKEEILEVIQLTSIMGIHSMTMGVPILMEEIKKNLSQRPDFLISQLENPKS